MRFSIKTKGFSDIIDITSRVKKEVEGANIKEGICLVFVAHSTCGLTIIEYEEGAIKDLKRILEKIAPLADNYEHGKKWNDTNGFAHVRGALLQPDLMVPVENGQLILGNWQQIVLADFDDRPREREITVKIVSQ